MPASPLDPVELEAWTSPAGFASTNHSTGSLPLIPRRGLESGDDVNGAAEYISNRSPIRPRDLAYAASLAGAAERMLGQPNLASLWPVITAEAAKLVSSHAVAIVRYGRGDWSLVAAHHDERSPVESDIEAAITAAAQRGWLREPAYIDDLGRLDGMRTTERRLRGAGSGSLLVVGVDCSPSNDLTRLLWFSQRLGAFGGFVEVAEIFGWHVSAAVRDTMSRESLSYAIAARSQIGQAQGILMTRDHLTADEAFEALRRQSQSTNIKLHIIAGHIINGGLLDVGQSRSSQRRP
jgi:hypothetical protein